MSIRSIPLARRSNLVARRTRWCGVRDRYSGMFRDVRGYR